MASFAELSPTLHADNENRMRPEVLNCGFTWMIVLLPGPLAPLSPPRVHIRPSAAPLRPDFLALPEAELRRRLPPIWRLRYGDRLRRAPSTHMLCGPSARLQWLLIETWLSFLGSQGIPRWLFELMSARFYFSVFGGIESRAECVTPLRPSGVVRKTSHTLVDPTHS